MRSSRRRQDPLLAPAATRAVIEEPPATPPVPPAAVAELTPGEREVLDLLARGLSNAEICARLVVSEATAKTHVARILQNLGLRDRIQVVIYACETGLGQAGFAGLSSRAEGTGPYRADGAPVT